MKNSYFLKKKIFETLKASGFLLLKAGFGLYKFIFAKRTVLFVTNQKIRSINLGPALQAMLLLLFIWIGNLFMQSVNYNDALAMKSEEINRLKSANEYFEEEFSDVNEKLKKINEYLISITGYNQNVSGSESNFKQPKNFQEKDLSKQDKNTLNEVKNLEIQLANVQSIAQSRIKKIESAIVLTGLSVKKMPAKQLQKASMDDVKEVSLNGKKFMPQGGPLEDDSLDFAIKHSSLSAEDSVERQLENVKFSGDIDYLIVLERLANVLPFAKPMKNYYISSTFGGRTDPLTHRSAVHKGLDFVGSTKEKIISPSRGKVILAGRFSDYGNAIVIDHGFGVTTRYGHLSEIKVTAGQVVDQGQVIALQGSTGRSTGAHLHYEVRYKNNPLNPKKFLEAGEALLNEERRIKHVNS